MTQADRALIDRMPEKGVHLIDYYKWLVHNHFILDPKPNKPRGANELVYTFSYDPDKKRYAGYKIYLHIKKAADNKDPLSKLDEELHSRIFEIKKTAKTAPITFKIYCSFFEDDAIGYFYAVLENPKGETILLD